VYNIRVAIAVDLVDQLLMLLFQVNFNTMDEPTTPAPEPTTPPTPAPETPETPAQ
jgi:hypothetical protein